MKIIFSRKGFDSSFGGAPSPILPDGSLLSLPIPGGSSPLRYGHIQAPLKLDAGRIAETLTKGKIRARHPAHLDPDLDERSLPRIDGWRPSLGQTGAAQAHLAAQGVGPGDLFLFFGWFRKTVFLPDGSLAYDSSSPAIHTLFGHLQIESSLPLGPRPDAKAWLRRHPWLLNHPHLSGTREANNTLHLASPDLLLPGLKQKLPGAGAFLAFSEPLRLSAPDSPKSLWNLPACFAPWKGAQPLSYHADQTRWGKAPEPDRCLLQTVAKGQEFVIDCERNPEALLWAGKTIGQGMDFKPSKTLAFAPKKSAKI